VSRPNILWICTDQQRWDTLGCYGNDRVATPRIDGLAASSTLFEGAYCQSPICTPSRGSFLTGRYPRTCRSRQNGADIPADEVLVTRLFHDAGYACGLSGKLHLSTCNPTVCHGSERRIDDGYDVFHWSHDPEDLWIANEYHQWVRGKGREVKRPASAHSQWVRDGAPEEDHHTTFCAEKAVEFMRSAGRLGKPWLFSVNIFDPHHAFDPPAQYLERYLRRLDDIPLPPYTPGELDDKPVYQRIDHQGAYGHKAGLPWDGMSARDHRVVRAAYWAMCDLIDVQVGRMLDELDRTGQRENTIVVFMSDHGEMLGDHGIYLKGPYFYEPAVRVPLVISWPGRIAPRRSPALVELADIAQTLLDAAGLPHHPGMQGRSLWPLLSGSAPADRHRDDVYSEYYNAMPWHRDPTAQMTMVRTDRHKIVVDHGNSTGELYDLEADPAETRNLWSSPRHRDLKGEMLLRLANRMAFTVDPLPVRQADW
jgi:arylsulfatase